MQLRGKRWQETQEAVCRTFTDNFIRFLKTFLSCWFSTAITGYTQTTPSGANYPSVVKVTSITFPPHSDVWSEQQLNLLTMLLFFALSCSHIRRVSSTVRGTRPQTGTQRLRAPFPFGATDGCTREPEAGPELQCNVLLCVNTLGIQASDDLISTSSNVREREEEIEVGVDHYITCNLADAFIQSDLLLIRLSRRHTPWSNVGLRALLKGPTAGQI